MVVAWQCSHCLVELADEQMAAGVDAIPPAAAASSLRQVVSPYSTANNRTVLVSGGHRPSSSLQRDSHDTSVAAAATGVCRRWAYPHLSFRHSQLRRTPAPCQEGALSYTGVRRDVAQDVVDLLILVFGTRLTSKRRPCDLYSVPGSYRHIQKHVTR